MIALCWNCQGLGSPWTVREFGDLLRRHNPDLVFLSETKYKFRKLEVLKTRFNLFGVGVEVVGKSGGLALLWRKDVVVDLISFSRNYIDVLIHPVDGTPAWRFTGFYGEPEESKRERSWDLLKQLGSRSNRAWFCGGDFNEILTQVEKTGGALKSPTLMKGFREALISCGLSDIGFEGYPFTWCDKRLHPHTIWERLDRGCATAAWTDLFPRACIKHLDTRHSDHKALLLDTCPPPSDFQQARGRRKSKFEAMWLKTSDCECIIKDSWGVDNDGMDGSVLWHKISNCRVGLLKWSKDSVGQLSNQIKSLKDRIHEIRKGPISTGSRIEDRNLVLELEDLLDKEELKWKQRSKVHWLQEGDLNTSYFHSRATERKRRNLIRGLIDSHGNWQENQKDLEQIILAHFQSIFTSTDPCPQDIQMALEGIVTRVTPEMNRDLLQPYGETEVKIALDSMFPFKSPGPDGLPVIFFQKFWHIIRHDIVHCIVALLNDQVFEPKMNYTHIVLIQKIQEPVSITQFRPISLSNVIYKLATKAITNRLKPWMNSIINETQSAFIPGSLISDNVLVAFELNHFLKNKRNGKKGFMTLKLDMSKAYDRVEWVFLEKVMVRLGFDARFVSLVMLCVQTVTYSVLINGVQCGFFHPGRGLRQGDPLSPYLFLFCSEAFSGLLRVAEEQRRIMGVKISRRAPCVSHLLFADDTLVCCEAKMEAAASILDTLRVYERASGQQINLEKSTLVFSKNCSSEQKQAIQSILNVQVEDGHDKYLGLPALVGKSKREVFGFLGDHLWDRIKGYKEKSLSTPGKEVLIKAVLQAIPTYAMSCFKFPNNFIGDLEALIRNYWWDDTDKKRIHWRDWKFMCKSKRDGGIGFRNLKAFNLALLAKQAWRVVMVPNCLLARILKARYFRNSDFFAAKKGTNSSFTWQCIFRAKGVLEAGIRWRIGNGKSVKCWGDKWIPKPLSFQLITPPAADLREVSVIDQNLGMWKDDLLTEHLWEEDRSAVLQIPLGDQLNDDVMVWHYNNNGCFSVKSAYHLIMNRGLWRTTEQGESSSGNNIDWNFVWSLNVVNKVKMFLWRACNRILPTKTNLKRRKVCCDDICPVCGCGSESVEHIFTWCHFARQVWAISNLPSCVILANTESMLDWIRRVFSTLNSAEVGCFPYICWAIWGNRNRLVAGEVAKTPMEVYEFAKKQHEEFLAAGVLSRVGIHQSPQAAHLWQPPPCNIIKINFDGALFQDEGETGLAAVARNDQGRWEAWSQRLLNGRLSAANAEALAAKLAVELGRAQGWQQVILEGDCANVIRAIDDDKECMAEFGPVVADIRRLCAGFESFSFNTVKRGANDVAHQLAHRMAANRNWIRNPTV